MRRFVLPLALLLAAPAAHAALPERHVGGVVAPPTPTAGKGAVVVHSNPSGKLLVDGRDSGLRTPGARLELDPGAHTLQVLYDDSGQPSGEKPVLIAPGATTTHNFVRKEPASKFEQDCKNGSKEDCWKYGTALIEEKRFDEAIKVFEDWARNNRADKRAPIAKFLADQTRKHAAELAAKGGSAAGGAKLPGTAAQTAPVEAGAGTEPGAAPAVPGEAPTAAREPAPEEVSRTSPDADAAKPPAAAEGSATSAEETPRNHLGFSALMGFIAALVAGGALYLWRRKQG